MIPTMKLVWFFATLVCALLSLIESRHKAAPAMCFLVVAVVVMDMLLESEAGK